MSIIETLGIEKYHHHISKTLLNVGKIRNKNLSKMSEIKVAFLGGSVTTGYTGDSCDNVLEIGFPQLTVKKLQTIFPKAKIIPLYAGCAGTGCNMGLVTTELLIRDFKPDMVFLDYAINEEMSPRGIALFEGLIRKLLNLESHPDIFPVAVFLKDGYSCEEYMQKVSEHYDLYMCGLRQEFFKLFGENKLKWEQYSQDQGHPNQDGHKLIFDSVSYMLDKMLETEFNQTISDQEKNILPQIKPPLVSDIYENIKLVFPFQTNQTDNMSIPNIETDFITKNCQKMWFDKRLECAVNTKGYIKYKGKFSTAVVVFLTDNSKNYGTAIAKVDGKKTEILQGYSIFGWKNPFTKVVFTDKGNAKGLHTLEINMEQSNKEQRFYILAIGVG